MSMQSASALPSYRAAAPRSEGGFLDLVRARIAETVRFHRTRRELLALSERELEDIGIAAYEIDRVASDASRNG